MVVPEERVVDVEPVERVVVDWPEERVVVEEPDERVVVDEPVERVVEDPVERVWAIRAVAPQRANASVMAAIVFTNLLIAV